MQFLVGRCMSWGPEQWIQTPVCQVGQKTPVSDSLLAAAQTKFGLELLRSNI